MNFKAKIYERVKKEDVLKGVAHSANRNSLFFLDRKPLSFFPQDGNRPYFLDRKSLDEYDCTRKPTLSNGLNRQPPEFNRLAVNGLLPEILKKF